MSQRPTREKRPPAYLKDYECDNLIKFNPPPAPAVEAPPGTEWGPCDDDTFGLFSEANPSDEALVEVSSEDDATEKFMLGEQQFLVDALLHNEDRVMKIVREAGSRSRARRLVERMRKDYEELCPILKRLAKTEKIESERALAEVKKFRDMVEDCEDEVDDYLEARQDDAPSVASRDSFMSAAFSKRVDKKVSKDVGRSGEHEGPGPKSGVGKTGHVTVVETEDKMVVEFDSETCSSKEDEDEEEVTSSNVSVKSQELKIKAEVAAVKVKQEKELFQEEQRVREAQYNLKVKRMMKEAERAALESDLLKGVEGTCLKQKSSLDKDDVVKEKKLSFNNEETVKAKDPLQKVVDSVVSEFSQQKTLSPKSTVTESSLAQTNFDIPKTSTPCTKKEDKSLHSISNFYKGLAKPRLPKFNGDQQKYEDWREQFRVFVETTDLPARHKMIQLKGALEGRPAKLVERLGYTEDELEMALFKLDQRYGGETRQQQHYIDAFLSTPKVSEGDLEGLEDLANQLCDFIAKMHVGGQKAQLLGPSALYTLVQQKVPKKILVDYKNLRDPDKPDGLASFGAWLNAQVCMLIETEELRKEHQKKKEASGKAVNKSQTKGKGYSYGGNTKKTKEDKAQPFEKHKSGTFTTKTSESDLKSGVQGIKCPLCEARHHVCVCDNWKEKSVDQRWAIAKEHKLCYRCLCAGHQGRNCKREARVCGLSGCKDTHHRHLHAVESKQAASKKNPTPSTPTSAFGISGGKVCLSPVSLRVIPVHAVNADGKRRRVNAFLDEGSDSSYISRTLAVDLGLHVEDNSLRVTTLTNQDQVRSGLTIFNVESEDGKLRSAIGARVLDSICDKLQAVDWSLMKEKWSHLSNIHFPKIEGRGTVDVLLGADHPELGIALEERRGQAGEPVARRTPLGWTCIGAMEVFPQLVMSEDRSKVGSVSTYNILTDRQLDESLRRLWEMDVISNGKSDGLSPEEREIVDRVEKSRCFVGGHYQLAIPWRHERPSLPNNFEEARKRLFSLEKALLKKPKLATQYCEGMQSNIDKGYLKKVTHWNVEDRAWYLPHFPVVREDKETTKVRIVFDSAAKCRGVSLNDQMDAGPKLQRDIFDILVKFRHGLVALMGDIKEMFSQVLLEPKDRAFHRILWRGFDMSAPIEVYESTRVTFGDKASPFLAQYILQKHAEENQAEFTLAAQAILASTYMDDILASVEDCHLGIQLRQELTELLKKAGFDARKWCCNDSRVLEGVPLEDQAKGIVEVSDGCMPSVKSLGVLWNTETDCFGFCTKDIDAPVSFTKRSLLSRVATLFDPLQFLAPFSIRAKMLLQKTWVLGLHWDDPLPVDLVAVAHDWFEELKLIDQVTLPRCYFKLPPESYSEVMLHTFSDASSDAYGAVSYLRTVSEDQVSLSFVAAKAKVTPLKVISIPRLELMAAILGYRLTEKITKLLDVSMSTVTFWTDSMDVVHWVRGQSRAYKPFVANRISELQSNTVPDQWRFVPGKLNPADVATRGMYAGDLIGENPWFDGPGYLKLDESVWPETKLVQGYKLEEVKKEVVIADCNVAVSESMFIDCEKFSTWIRLVRTVGWLMRLCRLTRSKVKGLAVSDRKAELDPPTLSCEDLDKAERVLIKEVQQRSYPELIEDLRVGRGYGKSNLKDLAPFLDECGILRVGGRLQNSGLPYDVCHPVILPPHHHISELLIRHAHSKMGHVRGVNAILAELREKYWIVNGREAVKKITYGCYWCRRRRENTATQVMAPLPSSRTLKSLRAFSCCGVDYAGPFVTKITRRVTAKRYLCLFTCLQVRAVHLEIVHSMETDGFLLAFSRMTARRGKPKEVVSDNGSNFVGAERQLKELVGAMDQKKILDSAANQGIQWHFGPPYGPHHGGVYEALIKSTKKAMYAILSNASLTDEELLTASIEVEGMLNSRPLTYCSSDPLDEPVLTPNHFLFGQCSGQLAPQVVDEVAYNPRQRWRYVQDLMSKFWQRWNKEYLVELQRRKKWQNQARDFAIGDVVVMCDPGRPRGSWPLARVLETKKGADGHVRTVRILSNKGEYIRPITRLVPLVEAE